MPIRQVFIDTETTGLSPRQGHRLIEIAAVEAVNGKLTGRTFHTYLDPERPIDRLATRVHGITSDRLVGEPRFADIAHEFLMFIQGAQCLMHNAPFDCSFIDAELERIGSRSHMNNVASSLQCTKLLAKRRLPGMPSVSLDALIQKASLNMVRGTHSALEDAQLLAAVYFRLLADRTDSGFTPSKRANERIAMPSALPVATPLTSSASLDTPQNLRMELAIELHGVRDETFFYRGEHKPIIDYRIVNNKRWSSTPGPLLYGVTDTSGVIRYIGKSLELGGLRSRWVRRNCIHHGGTRKFYMEELTNVRRPLQVWSITTVELRRLLPPSSFDDRIIAKGLEALWQHRWKSQLRWIKRVEPLVAGFDDGDYWMG